MPRAWHSRSDSPQELVVERIQAYIAKLPLTYVREVQRHCRRRVREIMREPHAATVPTRHE